MSKDHQPVPQGRIRRTMPLAGFAARAAGGRLIAGLRERTGGDGAVDRFHERTAERYTDLLGHSKGVLMKAGQLLSLVDARALGDGGYWPYQKFMSRLQSEAPPMHPALVHEILQAELGPARKLFIDFSDEPFAAASIGQVHRAVLRDGRHVAVKIQYPGVAQAIRDDLANTELIATFLRFVTAAAGVKPDVRSVAREAAARILEEVDYRHEAKFIQTFDQLYRGHPFIRVPELVPEASRDQVLTMTYLDGMDFTAAQQADQDLKNTWGEAVMRFCMSNFRHASLLHADPHPGNYRFNRDGTVGFVDFGCIKVLPEAQRWRTVAMARAALDGRKADYRELMIQAGFLSADSDLSADELYEWQAEMNSEIYSAPQPVTYTSDTAARSVHGLVDLRDRNHPMARMNAPDDFVFLARVQIAVFSVCAGLAVSIMARALIDDMDGIAEPISELGKLHHAWVAERGLPGALDHHDRP